MQPASVRLLVADTLAGSAKLVRPSIAVVSGSGEVRAFDDPLFAYLLRLQSACQTDPCYLAPVPMELRLVMAATTLPLWKSISISFREFAICGRNPTTAGGLT